MNISKKIFLKTLNTCKYLRQNFSKSFSAIPLLSNHNNGFLSITKCQPTTFTNIGINFSKFSSLVNGHPIWNSSMSKQLMPSIPFMVSSRTAKHNATIIKWNKIDGTRMSNEDVLKRFKRLDWGIWIRPKAGAKRLVWKKKLKRMNRLRQNVFCSQKQCRRLDKMVTRYWRTPRVYADDPYAPYMRRDDLPYTRTTEISYN